jgi:hypothetical protein
MNFDDLCDRLTSLYDVGNVRAAAVANERLQRMCAAAKSIRALRTNLGPTVAEQATYALAVDIVQVYKVRIAYASGNVAYTGTESLDAIWELQDGNASGCGNWYAVQPDADASQATGNLLLYPAPSEAGAAITGLVAIIPAAITYGDTTGLPIPLDCHEHLLAGCKAELSDEESTDSAKFEAVFEAGVKRLSARESSRGKGSDGHRLRVANYDFG